MIVKFKITEQARKEADKYAFAIIDKGITNPDHPSGVNGGSIYERYYAGYLGEWAFNEFLIKNKIKDKVRWDREADGIADKGDFFFGAKVVDVKTASKSYFTKLMIPLTQFMNSKKDYYVATRIDGEEITIMGYATGDDMARAKISDFGIGATKYIPFDKLRKMDGLIRQDILKKWD